MPSSIKSALAHSLKTSTQPTPNNSLAGERPRKPFVQRYFLLLMLALAFWLVIGRAIVGSAGWMMLILLLTVAPILVIYGIVITLLSMFRYRKNGYVFDKRTILLAYGLVGGLFVYGFTLIDGGDSKDSANSGIISIGEALTGTTNNAALMSASTAISNISFVVSFVLMILLFLAVLSQRGSSKVEDSRVSPRQI